MSRRSKNFVMSFEGAEHPQLDALRESIKIINRVSSKKFRVSPVRLLGAGNEMAKFYPAVNWGVAKANAGYTDVYVYEVKGNTNGV